MDYEKTRTLIRELRIQKNWSQEQLADKVFLDRTAINKIEKGTRNITIDELILLSDALNITIEELVAGEIKQKDNENLIKNKFHEYLKSQNTKLKKMRLCIFILLIILIVCFIGFTITYFFQNYNSIRVYRFYGTSQNYEITDGLLVISKKKIYFKINDIQPEVNTIAIYTEINNNKEKVYEGSPDVIIQDIYGYSEFINYNSFIKGRQKIYIMINGEEIELKFEKDFINDVFFYKAYDEIGDDSNKLNSEIPKKIEKLFNCNNEGECYLNTNNENIIFNSGMLTVINDSYSYLYDIESKILNFQDYVNPQNNVSISIQESNLICLSGNCNDIDKTYSNFSQKYISAYLE